MLTAFLLQTSVSILHLGLEFVGFHRKHFHATNSWHIGQILEFFMNNKKAGWNHSKAILLLLLLLIIITIVIFYYRFQTCSMHILLEVDHEKNALCHARASSFSRSTSKRGLIRPNFSIPRVLLLLARSPAHAWHLAIFYQTPFAIQRASSRAMFLF